MPRRALLLAVLLLAPLAAAQLPPLPVQPPGGQTSDVSVTMLLQDPGLPLVPARPYSLTLLISYQYGPGGSVPPDQDIAPSGRVCGEVSVPNPPPWARVQVLPPNVCFEINPTFAVGGTTVDNTTIVEVNVTEGAPALEPYNFTVQFRSPAYGSLAEGQGETSRVIMPGYVGKLALQAPGAVVIRGGQAQPVPIVVRNLGNGPIEVRFTNASAPQGVRIRLPERVVLRMGEERTVHLTLNAPWTAPVKGMVEVQAVSAHPSRPDLLGDAPRARMELQGKAAVPGAELGLAVLALLGAAVAARRPR